ncbi:Pycsar system effector family protein [Rhodococcus qingshengii]|uniref:Pycsar system effector family protein n=1 Tax=unclassified Rhodococcus (in: high G+C Gram-positive bacteria) TaxID=192944 RepID=UPI003559204C
MQCRLRPESHDTDGREPYLRNTSRPARHRVREVRWQSCPHHANRHRRPASLSGCAGTEYPFLSPAWTVPIEHTTRSIVEPGRDRVQVILTETAQVSVLAQVLTQQAVRILVRPALPRPSLGLSREHKKDYRDHLIYFGHLRHWNSQTSALAARFRAWSSDDENEQLAEHLLNMSRPNWWKHRLLQWTLYVSGGAALFLALAVLWRYRSRGLYVRQLPLRK